MPISEVFNMDCMEYMRQFPDKHFELAVVDPPYGIGRDGAKETTGRHGGRKAHAHKGWDTSVPPKSYFDELRRVSENQIIWGANYFTKNLPPSMGWIFWDKGQRIRNSDGEMAYTSFSRALRVVEYNRVELLLEVTIHPTQKPVALYKWIFQNYAKPGWKILDTHLGSGSSRIAAWDMGLDFYATELDADYFEAMEKRFQAHISKPPLFAPDQQYTFTQTSLFK